MLSTNLQSNPAFRDYSHTELSYDELVGTDGKLRPHWETFFTSYHQLGDQEIISRNEDILRMIKENGVT